MLSLPEEVRHRCGIGSASFWTVKPGTCTEVLWESHYKQGAGLRASEKSCQLFTAQGELAGTMGEN